ncbi:MAG: DUF2441 domain-containing protein [Phycisphaeraceae bacterium]
MSSLFHVAIGDSPTWVLPPSIETHPRMRQSISISDGKLWDSLKNAPHRPLRLDAQKLGNGLTATLRCLREVVFELIRQCEFPTKPSRLRCHYFTGKHALNYWHGYLASHCHGKVFEVEVDPEGLFHFGNDDDFNLHESRSLADWCELARRYWSMEDRSSRNGEILYAGVVLRTRELPEDELRILLNIEAQMQSAK